MLVLSRQARQRIRLGDSIVLTVVGVRGDRVRLGIEAPPELLVLRDELQTFGESQDGHSPSGDVATSQTGGSTQQ